MDRPAIFLSYRRDDAQAHAGRLFDWLARQFGRDRIFLDTDKIAPGDDFPRVLDERLAASDVVLAVVGPRWASIADAEGRRRLEQDDDFVRREIVGALARGKRVVPVLVGGARMPAEPDLPAPLRAFAARNAVAVGDASFERDFDVLVDAVLARPRNFARRELDRLQRLVFVAKRTAVVAPLVVAVLLLAVWMRALDAFALDTQAATYLLWAAELVSAPRRDAPVRLVTIDAETERTLGRGFGRDTAAQWREDHARLIDRAAAAGAAAVVFDLYFESGQAQADAALAAAVERARTSPAATRVVLGVRTVADGKPLVVAPLAGAAEWGSLCLVRRLGYTFLAPLAVLGGSGKPVVAAHTPGLALAAVARDPLHSVDLDDREIRLDGAPPDVPLRYSGIERIRSEQGECRTLARGDDAAMLLVRPAPPGYWRDARRSVPYAALLDPARGDAGLKGAILLVGATSLGDANANRDAHELVRGFAVRKVYGVELQADAIASLATGDVVAFAAADLQAVTMTLMALGGAAASLVTARLTRGRRRLALAGIVFAYLLVAVGCAAANVLLNVLYDLAAFFAAYALLAWLQRRTLGAGALTEAP